LKFELYATRRRARFTFYLSVTLEVLRRILRFFSPHKKGSLFLAWRAGPQSSVSDSF
jgi:hypothetical protein